MGNERVRMCKLEVEQSKYSSAPGACITLIPHTCSRTTPPPISTAPRSIEGLAKSTFTIARVVIARVRVMRLRCRVADISRSLETFLDLLPKQVCCLPCIREYDSNVCECVCLHVRCQLWICQPSKEICMQQIPDSHSQMALVDDEQGMQRPGLVSCCSGVVG